MIRALAIVSLSFLFLGTRPNQEKSRVIEKTFAASSATTLKVLNSFGNVNVVEWDRPEIAIKVIIYTTETDPEKAIKLLNKVEIDIRNSGADISYVTRIEEQLKGTIQVDYEVLMPVIARMELTNSFGNIRMGVTGTPISMALSYGELEAVEFGAFADLKLDFISGSIGYFKAGKMLISYSKLEVDRVQKMDLTSKFSDLQFEFVDDIKAQIKYGELEIEEANTLVADVHFAGLEIDWIKSILMVEGNYVSDFQVNKLNSSFKQFEFKGQFSPIYLKLEEGLSADFEFDLGYSELNNLAPQVSYRTQIREMGKSEFAGSFGAGDSNRIIKIESSNGNVKIR